MNEGKGQRKISDRQILALLRQNYSVSEIAGELDVCADAIRKRMKRMGRKALPYVMQSESEILGIQLNTAQQLSFANKVALSIIADDESKTAEKLAAMKRVEQQNILQCHLMRMICSFQEVAKFQTTVLEVLGEVDTSLRDEVLKRLRQRRATANLLNAAQM